MHFYLEISIIRGSLFGFMDDNEEIAIVDDSISHLIPAIPSLPNIEPILEPIMEPNTKFGFENFTAIQLPNGDILLAGGLLTRVCRNLAEEVGKSNKYVHYRKDSDQWTTVATMKMARYRHASILIDGCVFTTGGIDSEGECISHHEKFSFEEGVEDKKEMPIALEGHTATIFGKHKLLICGGQSPSPHYRVCINLHDKVTDDNIELKILIQSVYHFFMSVC